MVNQIFEQKYMAIMSNFLNGNNYILDGIVERQKIITIVVRTIRISKMDASR